MTANTPADTQAQIEPNLPDTSEEARNLATEGLEEIKQGNKEEGKFLIDEARQLDKEAVAEVVGNTKV